MVQYELGKKETREGGQEPIPFAEYIKRYNDEDLYCVTGLPKLVETEDIVLILTSSVFLAYEVRTQRNVHNRMVRKYGIK